MALHRDETRLNPSNMFEHLFFPSHRTPQLSLAVPCRMSTVAIVVGIRDPETKEPFKRVIVFSFLSMVLFGYEIFTTKTLLFSFVFGEVSNVFSKFPILYVPGVQRIRVAQRKCGGPITHRPGIETSL